MDVESSREQLARKEPAAATDVEHPGTRCNAGTAQQVHDRRMHAPDVVRVADVVDPREVGTVVRVLARRRAGRSGRGCIGNSVFRHDGIAASHHALRKHHGEPIPRREPQCPRCRVDVGEDAVVPRVLGIADSRAGVRDSAGGDSLRLQHAERRDAGTILADAAVVEEHRGQRHLECECPRARPAVRAADDDRAGVVRCELGDRIDDDHAAAAAAHNLLLDHIHLR